MKKVIGIAMLLSLSMMVIGCNDVVEQGEIGRVKTADGFDESDNKPLTPGHHTCFCRDTLYRADSSLKTYCETMNILIGGKVNLKVIVTVRCGINLEREKDALSVFDKVKAIGAPTGDGMLITHQSLYDTYVKPMVLSIPKSVFQSKVDVEEVMANCVALEDEVRQKIMKQLQTTPMKVDLVEITNYDWPESITTAQEELAAVKLKEEKEAAEIRAALKRAEGELKVKEAEKLVQMKEAEAIAESIGIIKDKLKDSPEYLQWHTVKAMLEAAKGPNNAFILFPYNMPGLDVQRAVSNAQLKQMLESAKTK